MSTAARRLNPIAVIGHIVSVQGGAILAQFPQASVGDLCWFKTRKQKTICGQIVAFQENLFSLALFEDPEGIYPGTPVRTHGKQLSVPVGQELMGRVVNPLGIPIDDVSRPLHRSIMRPVLSRPPNASMRPLIDQPLVTGVRAIDGFCTLGTGQRIGIFASAGVGKSTLLAMIARRACVDVIVVALVGERSREVREFIDETLGAEGLARSVIVVATSDDSSLLRQTAPYTATTIAEHFRDQGKNVLLIVDSLTRMARAVRETSLAAGDIPVRHGYTNSVYTQLPKLLERAGRSMQGSITALYTVLTNQEEDIDPLADEIKSLLDGHICLRHEIAALGVLPAIDITQSISRLFSRLNDAEHKKNAHILPHATTRFLKERQIVLLGGVPDTELSRIISHQQLLLGAVRQPFHATSTLEETRTYMREACQVLAK